MLTSRPSRARRRTTVAGGLKQAGDKPWLALTGLSS